MTIKLVLCTTPDEKTAQLIASTLVEEKLAACVNIIKGIESVYEWQGKVETDAECQHANCLLKRTHNTFYRPSIE